VSTYSTDISASPRTPSVCRQRSARRCHRGRSIGTTDCSSAQNTWGSPSPPTRRRWASRGLDPPSATVTLPYLPGAAPRLGRGVIGGVSLVGVDDVGDDAVPDDVASTEVHERQALHA